MVDDAEMRALYEGSSARLVGQVYAITGDFAAAQDAVQEAFVRALTHRSTLARTDNPEAWVRTVAINVARSRWRRLRRLENVGACWPGLGVPADVYTVVLEGDDPAQVAEAAARLRGAPVDVLQRVDVCPPGH